MKSLDELAIDFANIPSGSLTPRAHIIVSFRAGYTARDIEVDTLKTKLENIRTNGTEDYGGDAESEYTRQFEAGKNYMLDVIGKKDSRISTLELAVKRLTEALEYYADEGNWHSSEEQDCKTAINADGTLIEARIDTDAHFVGGKEAREALAEIEQMKLWEGKDE